MPTIELDLAEPDWLELSGGRWTPWVIDEDGNQLWNPVVGFNNWVESVPIEQRAYPRFVEIHFANRKAIDPLLHGASPSDPQRDWNENGESDWEEAREALSGFNIDAYADAFEQLTRAPAWGEPMLPHTDRYAEAAIRKHGFVDEWLIEPGDEPEHSHTVIESTGNALGWSRMSAQLNVTLMAYVIENNRADLFCSLAQSNLRLGDLIQEQGLIIHPLVGTAIQRLTSEQVAQALRQFPDRLSESQLEQLQSAYAAHVPDRFVYVGELLMQHDTARRMFNARDMVRFDGDMDRIEPLHEPYDELPEQVRIALAICAEPVIASSDASALHRLDTNTPAWHELDDDELPFELDAFQQRFVRLLSVAHGRTREHIRAQRAANQALQIYIGAFRHRLRHGQFPGSLADFDDDLMNVEHHDPFVRGGLLYRLDPELGPMVYSRGYDDDDDHGHHDAGLWRSNHPERIDGDFVFFPDPLRTQAHLIEASED